MKREIQRAVRAGGFDRARFTDLWQGELESHCVVHTRLRTPEEPQEKAVRTVITDLEKSGWSRTKGGSEDDSSTWSLERQHWTIDVMTGSVTAEELVEGVPGTAADETQAFTGMAVTAFDNACVRAAFEAVEASASPSPSPSPSPS
ncbi:hypothetical protein [Streptomyces sp. NPDC002644]